MEGPPNSLIIIPLLNEVYDKRTYLLILQKVVKTENTTQIVLKTTMVWPESIVPIGTGANVTWGTVNSGLVIIDLPVGQEVVKGPMQDISSSMGDTTYLARLSHH